jgi:hypothetical protein
MIYDWGRHPEELEKLWNLPAVDPVRPRWAEQKAMKRRQRYFDIGLWTTFALVYVLAIVACLNFVGWIF